MFSIRPIIVEYDTFDEFAKEQELCDKDLIFTNEYIFDEKQNEVSNCKLLFLEKYGTTEPSDVMVNKILMDLKTINFDRLIAIGGGTVIDIAKIIAVAGEETDVNNLYENMANLKKQHKLYIIPTTCGTGSEVTNIAVVNRTSIGTKQGLVSENMYPEYGVLISKFIESLPFKVFATSSIDALIHGIESFLSPKATPYSMLFSKKAIELILEGYKKVVSGQSVKSLASQFLRASNYAGIAFANAGCGTVHAMSYAFGGKYHVAHGESNYELLLSVLRYYDKYDNGGRLVELKKLIEDFVEENDVFMGLEELLNNILMWKPMSEYGMTREDVDEFAKSTIKNQQRLLANSYVEMTEEALRYIYSTGF